MEVPHRRISLRHILYAFLGLILTLIVALGLFVLLFDFSGKLQSYTSKATGREVTLGSKMDIDWSWQPRVHLRDVKIGNMEGGSDPLMLKADEIIVSIDLKELLRWRRVFPLVEIDHGDLLLEKDAKGNANWNFSDNPEGKVLDVAAPEKKTDIPAIGRLIVRDGRLRYKDPTEKTDIDSTLSTITGTAERHEDIKLEAKGKLQNQAFALGLQGGSILTLQDTDEPYPLDVTIDAGNTHAHIAGTVMDPVALKGLDLALRIKGANAADIFPLLGIALPPTPPYDVTGQLWFENKVWKFTGFTGHMGSSDLSGALSWDTTPKRPMFKATFTSNRLALDDLSGFIGATPDAHKIEDPKQMKQKQKAEASPYVIPDMPLDITRLAAMDANVDFTGKQVISSNLPLDDFFMHVELKDRVLELKPIRFGTADGDIAANLKINAREEPVAIGGDFQFHRLSLRRLFRPLEKTIASVPAKGFIGGTAKLQGHGKSLREMLASSDGTIGIGMEGGQLSNILIELIGLDLFETLGFVASGDKPVAIRCVIGDFGVKDGVMNSNTLIIDTSDTNIKGDGWINLKDETMDLRLLARPKDKSLLSLKSPLHVGGTLKHPSYGVEARGLVARGGVGAALGAILVPLGVLAFVEPGLGKDSDCATLIHQMHQDTGKSSKSDLVPKNPIPVIPKK